jgi:P-type Ca2+ transporter type 2C
MDTDNPWARPAEEVLADLGVPADTGLTKAEAFERRRRFGPNLLRDTKRRSSWAILLDQLKSILVVLLAAATVLSFAFGQIAEGVAILAVIAINTAMGFAMETRAVRSMEALYKMEVVSATVRREGRMQRVSAREIVPGDIVALEGGDVATADVRLLETAGLEVDESALTGESVPVGKGTEPVEDDRPLAERSCMLYKGTAVTRGSGTGVVTATGMRTELGRIAAMVSEAEPEATPLEKRLNVLGRRLVWVTLAIAAFVAAAGIATGREIFPIVQTAIALAVAAVPEGLPIVATIALSRGMWRMARRNALISRLSAVETLGAASIVFTDKTGTLTENRMTVREIALPGGTVTVGGEGLRIEGAFLRDGARIDPKEDDALTRVLMTGVLCNDATLQKASHGGEAEAFGDPMEVALLAAGAKAGLRRDELLERMPEARKESFDPEVKMMATLHRDGEGVLVAVKGAPEAVLAACTRVREREGERSLSGEDRDRWMRRNDEMAQRGLRMIAVATKRTGGAHAAPYEDLVFLGLVGLLDPPRREVRDAVAACREAGIRVVMVTGDRAATARAVAAAVGLGDAPDRIEVMEGRELGEPDALSPGERERALRATIFSRVGPKQKLDLIGLYQGSGAIVAMTGDGVNDAPALKKADIGVAMGRRGTQVAREAADMILKDDSFATIVAAVEQGRATFGNIRKFALYLLSCNVSEVFVVGIAVLSGMTLPILPLQILYLNLVTDVFPALALGVSPAAAGIMRRPPRPAGEPILTRRHWQAVAGYGFLISLSVLAAFRLAFVRLDMTATPAVTVSFLTLAFAQLWHVFNMRGRSSRPLRNEITGNRWVWGALALCVVLLLAAVYLPVLSDVLKIVDPGPAGWMLILTMSMVPLVLGQIAAVLRPDA